MSMKRFAAFTWPVLFILGSIIWLCQYKHWLVSTFFTLYATLVCYALAAFFAGIAVVEDTPIKFNNN